MSRRDRTGPMGAGSMTGRGLGNCTGVNAAKHGAGHGRGLGLARRCGCGNGFAVNVASSTIPKELLQKQKDILQKRLEVIDKQLENR